MKTFKGEVFCDVCGGTMALGIEKEIANEDTPGKEYIKRALFLTCSNQNCPEQNKRKQLPEG